MPIFRSLDLERRLIWQKSFLWKSAIFHSIKLPFDAEVDEKFLNVIYCLCSKVTKIVPNDCLRTFCGLLEDYFYWLFKDCFSGPLENYSKFHGCLYSKILCTNLLTRVLTLKTDGKASFITDLYCLFKSLAASEHLVLPTIQPSGFNMGTTLNMNLSLSWVATSESPERLKKLYLLGWL